MSTETRTYSFTADGEFLNKFEKALDEILTTRKNKIVTTYDNVDVFQPQQILWLVNTNTWATCCIHASYSTKDMYHQLVFSSQEARDKYILYNKPVLCYKDVVEDITTEKLREIVETKTGIKFR